MIVQLQNYISKTLLMTTTLIVLLVLGIDFLFAFVHELGAVGRGSYTTYDAFIHVAMTLPRRMYDLFPMSSLIGVLLGLGLLASHSELIVMRAAGVSISRITLMVFQFALILAIMMTLIGEYLVPKAEYWADAYKVQARSDGQAVLTVQGTWVRDGDDFIHIQSIDPDGNMQGVTIYDFNSDLVLNATTHIQSATFLEGSWQLEAIHHSVISATEVTTDYQATQKVEALINPDILAVIFSDPDDLSMRGLYHYVNYLKANDLDYTVYELYFWQKALQPLAIIVMILLAVPFIFGPLRSASMGLRLLAGIVVGFCFYVLSEVFGPLSMVYQLPAFWAAFTPILIFGTLGLYLIKRVR